MGPLGWQETVFIFVLALLIFGPKKLPELGKTIGKAMTEFRRASSELKATFDREMQSLDRENESLKQVTAEYSPDTSNYDYNSYDYGNYDSGTSETNDSTEANSSTESASATQGAESTSAAAPEGTVARGDESAAAIDEAIPTETAQASDLPPAPVEAAHAQETTEQKA